MRKWLIPLLIAVALVVASGVVYFVHFAGRVEMTAKQRKHLRAEAERLVAERGRIEQPDAAWIAGRLGERPTADDLARLGHERLDWLRQEHAARLQREHPKLWDIWNQRAAQLTGTNGHDKLAEAGDRAEILNNDERFRGPVLHNETLSPDNAAAFLAETAPLIALVREAAAADHIVLIPRRMETWLDQTEMPSGYQAFRVLALRVRLLADSGGMGDAVEELSLLFDVYARADWNLSLIGVIMHVVAGEVFLLKTALALVENHDIEPEVARAWLSKASTTKRDPALSIAVDLIQTSRITLTDPLFGFINMLAPDLATETPIEAPAVEEMFSAWRRNQAVCLDVAAYVQGERLSLLTPEGQQQIGKALERSPFLIVGNLVDHVDEQFKWAALDIRLAEREHGRLDASMVDDVLARWPALRAEWDGETLQLWVRPEYRFGREPDRPLHELKPLR